MYLSSNQELYNYLIELRAELVDRGATESADAVKHAIGNAASMSAEFLGESRIALRAVLENKQSGLADAERIRMEGIVRQISAAFKGEPQDKLE